MRANQMIRWVWRESLNSRKFIFFFIFNLACGLVGFVLLNTFTASLKNNLTARAKSFLSADLAVSARRLLSDEDLNAVQKRIPPGTKSSRMWEFFSMIAANEKARLVQVKGIDQNYPFYGDMILGSGRVIGESGSKNDLDGTNKAWVYPELLSQLDLKVGDDIKLGDQKFKITDTVTEDNTQTFKLASLAPKIYVSIRSLQESSLIQKGSTLFDNYLFQFPMAQRGLSEVERIASDLNREIVDTSIRISSPEEASEDSGRLLKYLSDYLGLVALVSLFLSSIGAAYLFRSFLQQRVNSVAILNTLGLQRRFAQTLYIIQIVSIGLVSAMLSLGISVLFFPLVEKSVETYAGLKMVMQLSPSIVVIAFLLGSVGPVLISLPFVMGLKNLPVSQIFQESQGSLQQSFKIKPAYFLPALVVFWVLSLWQSHSIKLGSLFVGIMLASLGLLAVLSFLYLRMIKFVFVKMGPKDWSFKYAFLFLQRSRWSSIALFLSLGLASLLMTLIPQVKTSIQSEVQTPGVTKLPQLFMFDIQDEQKEPLITFLKEKKIPIEPMSPMVRARIVKLNDENFEKKPDSAVASREQEEEARFRNRGVNLSYRDKLSEAEEIVEGQDFSQAPHQDEVGNLSLEKKYAERLGIKIGDVLTFDIQGVEVKGRVINFRKVQWNSFRPNFFILFEPGYLEDAPKTFLQPIPQMAGVDFEQLQGQLGRQFPNISIIDVHRLTQKVLDITDKMMWSLQIMAFLSLVVGLIVLYSILNHQMDSKTWDLNLLKILGASEGSLQKHLLIESTTISFIAGTLGSFLSYFISYLISLYFFDQHFVASAGWGLVVPFMLVGLTLVVALVATHKVVQQQPSLILSGQKG